MWYSLNIWRESIDKCNTIIDMKRKWEKKHSGNRAEWKLNIEKIEYSLKKVYMEKPQNKKFEKEVNKPMNEEM